MDSLGDETAASFTLNFDPAILANPFVELGPGVPEGTTLTTNFTAIGDGRLGILIDSGELFKAAASTIITVTFEVAADAATGMTPLTFDDSLINRGISNADADSLATRYESGTVVVLGRPGKSMSGRVMTADGHGIRNAVVVLTGNNLRQPITIVTGPLGYYRVNHLDAGETYVVSVAARRFRFTGPRRVVTVTESIRDVDFTAATDLPKPGS